MAREANGETTEDRNNTRELAMQPGMFRKQQLQWE